jgi:hypothetical protein
MSVNDFLIQLTDYNWYVFLFFISLPVLAYFLGFSYSRKGKRGIADYLFTVIIYLSSIPGITSILLIFYALFLTRQNLLTVNALFYFMPVVSMVTVFVIIGRKTDFERLPGFDRLSGLMLMIALIGIIVLFIHKTRIFIAFFGTIESLFVLSIVLFCLFKAATAKISGK